MGEWQNNARKKSATKTHTHTGRKEDIGLWENHSAGSCLWGKFTSQKNFIYIIFQ